MIVAKSIAHNINPEEGDINKQIQKDQIISTNQFNMSPGSINNVNKYKKEMRKRS